MGPEETDGTPTAPGHPEETPPETTTVEVDTPETTVVVDTPAEGSDSSSEG